MGQIILIGVMVVLGIILLIALFTKKEYSISSDILINKPKDVVFNYVKNISNQRYYSKWIMADPKIQLTNTGVDGTVGYKSAWTSEVKSVGVGEQEIASVKEGIGYDAILRFEKPFKGISYAHITTEAVGTAQTKVTTVFETKTPFPMSIMIPMIKKMLKKDMDDNSANLKKVLEKL